jgi:hypothetical protein
MAAQENWWESSPVVAKPSKVQQVEGGVYVPPAPEKPEKPKDAPSGYRYNAEGNVEFIPGGPADPGVKGLTESESKAVGFYQRMRSAETQMNRLGMGPQDWSTLIKQRVSPTFSRASLSDRQRTQLDLMENWIAASMRLESGAAIAPDEFEKQARIFFPQPGAGTEEKSTKDLQRELAILGFRTVAGPGALEADKNLRNLGFIDEEGKPIIPTGMAAGAEGGEKGVVALRVAEGNRFATDKDIENASLMQGAWQSGKSIDELQALAKSLNLDPLSPKTIEALQADTNRKLIWTPSRSGIREGAEPEMGMGSAIGAGSIRGFTGNLAEEALSLVDAEAAAKLQAATDFAQQQRPYSGMAGEFIGSTLSPISRFLPGGPLTKDVLEGAIYGIGEGRPGTDLVERLKTGATGGLLQGGFGAAARRFMPGGATPESAGIPEGEFVNVTGEVPAGMAPDIGVGGQATPSPTGFDMPTGAPTSMAPPIAGEAVEDAAAQIGSEEMINLAQKAVSRAPGASKARAELAELAKTNPEAKAAADRLGLELPVDVLSDNSQLKEVVGLTRAQIGSEAKQAWNETVQAASDRAHTAMDELDAVTDISQVSADVFDRLDKAQMGLGRQASDLRQEVTDAVDVRGRVDATGIKSWLQTRIDDLGGGKEGIAALSPEEKRLWGIVSKGQPTYALLNEQRDLIGQALEKGTGPWSNTNMKRLKDIYGSLADDQIKFIEASAGKEIADKQRAANTLFKQMYDGREQMERIFTKNLSGSLAPLMQRAITQGTKGNVQTLNTLVNIIPEDMRGKVLTSALFKAAKATDDTFSFTNFANIYRDLRANGAVYKQIAKAIGPEGDKLLTDLYAVSRRLSDADKAISRTGASTQLQLLNSERLLSRILMATGGAAGAGLIGSVLGGPGAAIVGAGLASAAPEIAQRLGKTNAQKLHNLISSEPFRDLTVSAATGDALERNINRVAGSKQFRDYAKLVGIDMKDARDWLNSAISKGATIAGTEAVGEKPMEAPTVEMPQ